MGGYHSFAFLFLFSNVTLASVQWNLSSRLDSAAADEILASRFLAQSEVTVKFQNLNFFIDGFLEFDAASEDQKEWRRFENGGFLREAYGEFTSDIFFLKVGRQSARWSESWILPSLDVWTGRRFERLFWEPLSYQLSHSSGIVGSLVQPKWSLDVALMWDVQRDSFPQPLPRYLEPLESAGANAGARLKFDLIGLQVALIGAQALDQQTQGVAASYAFEKVVPKFEAGTTYNNRDDDLILNRSLNFGSFGLDIFWNDWTLTPQITSFENEDPYRVMDPQSLYYTALQYDSRRHQVLIQGFYNDVTEDSFVSGEYTYKFAKIWSATVFAQNYYGRTASLTSIVYDQTGGTFVGFRLQADQSLLTRN
ncbi:MAG: hypothetical protein ACK5Y2_02920 [Bdellovibrionales bacterium]